MPYYRRVGTVPRKRHTMHKVTPGYRNEGIYYEECLTAAGFGRAYSLCYHVRPPTRVRKIEDAGQAPSAEPVPGQLLRHHHLKSGKLPHDGNILTGRIPLLVNEDVIISRCRPAKQLYMLYRNAAADEVLFIQEGKGTVATMFGSIPFKPLDYVVIPRCVTYWLEFDAAISADLLIIESTGSVDIPASYRNPDGQLRLGAPYSERDLHGPEKPVLMDLPEDAVMLIKNGSQLTRYTLAHHPFDVIGWDGMLYPFTFNALDFEPITGTIHQPPPVHTTFEAPGFVLCTFAPRMLDTHPDAVKVPYAHSNVQADEVLYYVQGQFGSRRGVEVGSFTLHPRGIPHGPHPGTIVASRSATRTDELAVMLDTEKPLHLTRQALELDDPSYPMSWLE